MKIKSYDHKKIEAKWQKAWLEKKLYSPDLKNSKKPFYNLMMYPYPSSEGMHVGNMYAFTGADLYGRFQRMRGYDVFEPIGLDGFGIHSENYAIQIGQHPKKVAKRTEKNFYKQLKAIGNSFDWTKTLETYDPDYYRWTQWLFIQMYKKGLAYKGKARVNWCPSCKTVLADEQVISGECERCKSEVVRKEMSSWYFEITKYAEKLLTNLDEIKWPERIKIAQRNWIGKKKGIEIFYSLKGKKEKIECFTTRPDTNFGATFVVVAPEYAKDKLLKIIPNANKKEVEEYINLSLNKTEQQRLQEGKKKTGVFTGLYAINQLNDYEMPIWVSDFVLIGVGTGAVVGVPGHDRRDFEFAKEFDLEIKRVVVGKDKDKSRIIKISQVQEKEGTMINSKFLDGIETEKAIDKMIDYLVEKGWGKRQVSYHLRDWLISRQRYWGPPIPMVNCKKCGYVPVSEENLPVELPEIEDFKPKGDGNSPLSNAPEAWKNTKCPKCKGKAIRELDVSDTFLDSSWYFLAYPNLGTKEWKSKNNPFNKEISRKWFPVSAYIGGAEHAVLHLLYSRFVTMVLKDMNYLSFEEPFPYLFGHGLLIKDGAKMSKSRGNVVIPDAYIEKYSADVLRSYLMFLGPFDQGGDFRDTGIEGMKRFLDRVWKLVANTEFKEKEKDVALITKEHKTIKKVTEDFESFRFNTALASIMEYVNALKGKKKVTKGQLKTLCLLLAPYAPHLTEEIWESLGEKGSIHTVPWPQFDQNKIKVEKLEVVIQVNGKLRGSLTLETKVAQDKERVEKLAREDHRIKKWIEKGVKETVFVSGRLINFVTKS